MPVITLIRGHFSLILFQIPKHGEGIVVYHFDSLHWTLDETRRRAVALIVTEWEGLSGEENTSNSPSAPPHNVDEEAEPNPSGSSHQSEPVPLEVEYDRAVIKKVKVSNVSAPPSVSKLSSPPSRPQSRQTELPAAYLSLSL